MTGWIPSFQHIPVSFLLRAHQAPEIPGAILQGAERLLGYTEHAQLPLASVGVCLVELGPHEPALARIKFSLKALIIFFQ